MVSKDTRHLVYTSQTHPSLSVGRLGIKSEQLSDSSCV